MQCPSCRKPMIVLEYRDVETDWCPACRGCWLDAGELELLLGVEPEGDLAAARAGRRRCPHCRRRMREGLFPGTDTVVDSCPLGHGLWLDSGELEAIAGRHSRPDRLAELSDYLRAVFADSNNNGASPTAPAQTGGTT